MFSLSPNTFFVLGERARVRGQHLADSRHSRFVPVWSDNDNETPDAPLYNEWPPSPDLSPRIAQRRAIRGERRRIGRNTDPGRREGLLPSLALGYPPAPLQGSQNEAAASLPLHFLKNVQSPDSAFAGMTR
jgi:hypothetical protein